MAEPEVNELEQARADLRAVLERNDELHQQVQTLEALRANADLGEKIATIAGKVGRVKKTGRNTFHGYHYATKDDIADAVNPLMAEQGLAIVPFFVKHEVEFFGKTSKGVDIHKHKATWNMLIMASGAAMNVPWYSESHDTDDKGVQKVITNGMRTFVVALFNIASGDADGEHDSSPQAAEHASAPAPRSSGRGVSAAALLKYAEEKEIPKAAQDWVVQKSGIAVGTLFKDMTPDQRREVMAGFDFWLAEKAKRGTETGQPLEQAPADEPQPDQPTAAELPSASGEEEDPVASELDFDDKPDVDDDIPF